MFNLKDGYSEVTFRNKFKVIVSNNMIEPVNSNKSKNDIVKVDITCLFEGVEINITELVLREILTREEDESIINFKNHYNKINSSDFNCRYLDSFTYVEVLKYCCKKYKNLDYLKLKLHDNLNRISLEEKKNRYHTVKINGVDYNIVKAAYVKFGEEKVEYRFISVNSDGKLEYHCNVLTAYDDMKWNDVNILDFVKMKNKDKKVPTCASRANVQIYAHNLKHMIKLALDKLKTEGNDETKKIIDTCDSNFIISSIYKSIQRSYNCCTHIPEKTDCMIFGVAKNGCDSVDYVETILNKLDLLINSKIDELPICPSSLRTRTWFEKDTNTQVFSFSIGCIGNHNETEKIIKDNIQLINDWIYDKFESKLGIFEKMSEKVFKFCMSHVQISRIIFTNSNLLEYTLIIKNCIDLNRLYLV